jgi:dipeptidyl aminopeptidase/acylaminoacyl peptidase
MAAPPTAEQLAAEPDFWSPSLSPDGQRVAMIARVNGNHVLGIVDLAAGTPFRPIQAVGEDDNVFIDWVAWKDNDRMIFGIRERARATSRGTGRAGGVRETVEAELPRVFAVNRDGSDLTLMFENQQREIAFGLVRMVDTLPQDPDHILLSAFARGGLGVFRVNIRNGRAEQIADGTGRTQQWVADVNGTPVIRIDVLPRNTGLQVYRRGPGQRDWVMTFEARQSEATQRIAFRPVGATERPGVIYVLARPDNAEFAALYAFDTATGEYGPQLSPQASADVFTAFARPDTRALISACVFAERLQCQSADTRFNQRWRAVEGFFDNNVTLTVASSSFDGQRMILRAAGPLEPPAFYLFDVAAMSVEPLAAQYGGLVGATLANVEIVRYAARDGFELWGYLHRPANAGSGPLPLIVLPHGGPEARDFFGFDELAQFFAARGYLVFQPNFRGGAGFGRAFSEAGYRQWGLRMQHDVDDGVQHLIDTGVADSSRMCIVGWSYGGYATLFAATVNPNPYRCGVSIAGVSDLLEMLAYERAAAGTDSSLYSYWTEAIGDPTADRAALVAASPARQAAQVQIPMLLMHGQDDQIVPVEQSRIMRDAMQRVGRPVEYIEYPDAEHFWTTFQETDHLTDLLQRAGAFVDRYIGTPPAQGAGQP